MPGVELGARYRAGREGARVIYRDGTSVQLQPFASIRFDHQPLKIEGRLVRVRRGHLLYEAPRITAEEWKSLERGRADLAAGRSASFDSVEALIEDLDQ